MAVTPINSYRSHVLCGNAVQDAPASGNAATAWTDICSCNICISHIPVGYAGGRATQERLPRALLTEFPFMPQRVRRSMGAIVILIFVLCDVAYADNNALEQWRSKAASIRQLLENDAQQAYVEVQSLQAELPADAPPVDRVRLLNLLSHIENYLGETDSSAAHAQQAFDLAKQHGDKAGQAEADINIALDAVNQGNIDAMIAADTHSLAILDGVDRPDLLAETMLRGSMMYNRLEMLEESVAIAVQAMEIAKRGNDDWVLAYAYQGMAFVYERNGRNEEARDNYAEMLKHAKAARSKVLEGTALNGLGATLNALGDHQEGNRLIRSAVDLDRAVGGPFYLSRSLFLLAEQLDKQGRYAEALPLLDEGVAIYRQRFNKIGLWWTLFKRSEIYQNSGKMAQADADAQDAYRLAERIKFPVYLAKSARRLSAIFAARGDYRQAYRLGSEADALSAKAASDNAGKHIVEMTKRYETESKQREIDKLNRRNQQQATELVHRALEQRWLWTVLGGSVVMLTGTGFFLLRLRGSHRRLKEFNTQALQAKNKLQATLDTIPDLLFEIGLDGRYYDYHSPRTDLLPASFEDLHGKTVADAMPADAAKIVMSALHEAHQLGISIGKQFQLRLPHGDFWFELSVASKPVADGEEPRLIVLSRNITERKHMEAQALQREQEFRVLVENSPDLIFRYDTDCRRIYTNPAVARLVGKWAESLLNHSPSEAKILSADQADKLTQMLRQVLATGLTAESEVECLDSNGQLHYFHNRYAPEFNAHGEVISVISIARDVTERKQAEQALIAREREFRTLAESLPDNIVRYNQDGRTIYFNPVLEKTLAVSAAEMLGTTVRELFPNGEYDDYAQLLDTVLANGEGGEIEKRVYIPDGKLHMIHNIRIVAERGEHGEVIGALAIGRNITEHKLSEEALRESEEKYRTLIQKIQAAVVVHGADTQILTSNSVAQEILGLSKDQLYGKTAVDRAWHFFREDGRTASLDEYPVNKVLASGKALVNYVLGVHRPNNKNDVWALVNADPVFGKDGEITQVIVTFIDITQRKHAEEALAVREREFRTLAENIPDLIIRYDADARKIYVNSGEPLGQTPEQAPLEVRAVQIDEFSQNIRRVLETGEPQELEVQVRNATEGMQIHNFRIVAERDEQGKVVGALAVGRDITKLKQAEHDIAIMSQALDKVHEAAYLTDQNARFLYVNDESCRALGYSRDELLTMSVMDIGPGWTVEMVREVLQRQHEEAAQTFEAAHLRKDGGLFPVEISASQFEYDGKTYGLALVRDITERKRAEDEIHLLNADLEQRVLERTEELRLQTRYLRTLIDTLPMMAWLKDKDSRFLVVNQAMASACARSVNELVGKSDLDCWPREHAEVYRADDAEVMTAGQRKTVEELLADARTGVIWVETCKAPVFDEDGSVLGTVGMARDISDRRALETAREAALAEAERLAKLRSEFMARMSHELRTPLNGIMGYAQILLGENRGDERQSAMLNVIQQSGEYLLNLINDILDFAKIEAGKQELSLSDVQLRRFLGNLAGIITIKAEQKGLVFVCDIAGDVPAGIRADETRLRQVLLNLLSNAVKFSERGQISLRVTRLDAGGLRLEVQDNGIGIEAGQLETIFHAFEQAGDTQYRTGGTGLGLPISRELARMMGSDIQVISRVGEGSTFWFDLDDASVVDVGEDIMATEHAVAGYHGLRRRVLVVDDDDENRALLIDMLRRLGLESCEAANGRACLDSAESQAPDLVLLEMAMPEMDGLETARRLRRLPEFGQTPIIAVSANASAEDIAEAGNAGVNVFLSTPIDIKRLMAQLAVLLKLDWIYAQPETAASPRHRFDDLLDAPPHEEMNILYRLAQEGSMRDIIRQTVHLEELDPRYSPFAEQLRVLAQGYQSKAILELVERYITTQLR